MWATRKNPADLTGEQKTRLAAIATAPPAHRRSPVTPTICGAFS